MSGGVYSPLYDPCRWKVASNAVSCVTTFQLAATRPDVPTLPLPLPPYVVRCSYGVGTGELVGTARQTAAAASSGLVSPAAMSPLPDLCLLTGHWITPVETRSCNPTIFPWIPWTDERTNASRFGVQMLATKHNTHATKHKTDTPQDRHAAPPRRERYRLESGST